MKDLKKIIKGSRLKKVDYYQIYDNGDISLVDTTSYGGVWKDELYEVRTGEYFDVMVITKLDGYVKIPYFKISSDTLKTILQNVPKELITKEFMEELDIDLDHRGVFYLDRCFALDKQGDLEKALSDKYKHLVEEDKLPDDILPFTEDLNTSKAMASLWQWTCTNVGFCYLQEAFKDGGYKLTLEKIEK